MILMLYIIIQVHTSYQAFTCVLVIKAPANPPKCGNNVNETEGSQEAIIIYSNLKTDNNLEHLIYFFIGDL